MSSRKSTGAGNQAKAKNAVDPLQAAFHDAFAAELRQAVGDLPLLPESRVLDVCAGDGFYSELLASHLDETGALTVSDLRADCLGLARKRLKRADPGAKVGFEKADAYNLPFDDETFDLAWCAQSFITLDDPLRALKEMRRVVRPGGHVAILESDEFHHLLLPWPVELEISIQAAIQASFKERFGRAGKAAPARQLGPLLKKAGLKPRRKRTYAADRRAPFPAPVQRFLRLHVRYLRKAIKPHLNKEDWARFTRYTDPKAEASIFHRDDFDLTCLNVLYVGQRV